MKYYDIADEIEDIFADMGQWAWFVAVGAVLVVLSPFWVPVFLMRRALGINIDK